jgi:Putative sensor
VAGARAEDGEVPFHLRLGDGQRTLTVPVTGVEQGRGIARTILVAPFQRRAWSELALFLISGFVGALGAVLIVGPMGFGVALGPVFISLILIAAGRRGVRGLGSWHRALARHFLNERIPHPDPFVPRPGLFAWLGSAFRDRASWRGPTEVTVDLPGHA